MQKKLIGTIRLDKMLDFHQTNTIEGYHMLRFLILFFLMASSVSLDAKMGLIPKTRPPKVEEPTKLANKKYWESGKASEKEEKPAETEEAKKAENTKKNKWASRKASRKEVKEEKPVETGAAKEAEPPVAATEPVQETAVEAEAVAATEPVQETAVEAEAVAATEPVQETEVEAEPVAATEPVQETDVEAEPVQESVAEAIQDASNEAAPSSTWVSTYEQWTDPANHFVEYLPELDQARVIFIGSSAFSSDGQGERPTTAEGMGYGLLLSYANNDQDTFDKFLRYTLAAALKYGCVPFDDSQGACMAKAPLMMPWIVNAAGQPFSFQSSQDADAKFSAGSSTGADIQIAWALSLASEKVKSGVWNDNKFKTAYGPLRYQDIFNALAKAIRLNDVDMSTALYTPGSHATGAQVLNPGYLIPQAFEALDLVPPPSISTACPASPQAHHPEHSLQLTFKNYTVHTVSIDYLGGSGAVKTTPNFAPKPGVQNGYIVSPLTTAAATFSSENHNDANAVIEATYYNENGEAVMKSHYAFQYEDGKWSVTDKGSTSQSLSCLTNNVATVLLTQDDISDISFSFNTVISNSAKAILNFQKTYNTALMPNAIQFGNSYPANDWSNTYSFDACRFPLWASAYISKNPGNPNTLILTEVLNALVSSVQLYIANGTLPSGGINAQTQEPIGSWEKATPALNAPIYLAAKLAGNEALADELEPALFTYDITANQPQATDPAGDSSPYFNAVIVLLTQALQKGLL
jgi:endo-1,4-beta-D-glucanase Y